MYLAFYRGRGDAVTWLIRLLTRGRYSHVALLFSDGAAAEATGRPFLRSAGVRWLPASELRGDDWDLVPIFATREQERHIRAFVTARIGARFAWGAVWQFVLPCVRPARGAWWCVDFVLRAFQSVGLLWNIPTRICPNGLIRLLQLQTNQGEQSHDFVFDHRARFCVCPVRDSCRPEGGGEDPAVDSDRRWHC
jgi:hypothetical protein